MNSYCKLLTPIPGLNELSPRPLPKPYNYSITSLTHNIENKVLFEVADVHHISTYIKESHDINLLHTKKSNHNTKPCLDKF